MHTKDTSHNNIMNNTTVSNTNHVFLDHTFEDDYQLCAAFEYQGQQVSLWRTSVEVVGAFHYDDPRAREVVAEVAQCFDVLIANPDMPDEERYTKFGYMDMGWHGNTIQQTHANHRMMLR